MSQLVVDLNELEGLLPSNGSRFRVVAQLIELEYLEGTTKVILGNLPEFRYSDEGKTLKATIGTSVYESTFLQGNRVPQRSDAVSVWLVVYALGEERCWEVLELKTITTKELNRLRIFWESSWGHEFRALSSSSRRDDVADHNEKL
ncbi:hypothetical protein ZYGR_0A04860 [Zygosaccharomyces rouxii]|uniref:Uncharacterized protein n=1 Tax=Zygosaccharomyces rouxii TaxID=4956 RepID=A0A1Q2ZU99_ZYGRO|nr:hypothetical protein ZYGR_0A04860 [Zygosaccharomyces rouxii]